MIEEKILSYDKIVGVHDMIIHDYGPGRKFASAHAEVSSLEDIMEIHDVIDLAERDIMNEFGLIISIHTDPIVTDDERINSLKSMTNNIVKEISPEMSIHDFRVVDGPTHTNLIFDLIAPHKFHLSNEKIIQTIEDKLSKIDERYFVVITIEHAFN
jgi:hypothetical protein